VNLIWRRRRRRKKREIPLIIEIKGSRARPPPVLSEACNTVLYIKPPFMCTNIRTPLKEYLEPAAEGARQITVSRIAYKGHSGQLLLVPFYRPVRMVRSTEQTSSDLLVVWSSIRLAH